MVNIRSSLLYHSPMVNKVFIALGRKEIIEILLEAGLDPNVFDHTNGTHNNSRYVLILYPL